MKRLFVSFIAFCGVFTIGFSWNGAELSGGSLAAVTSCAAAGSAVLFGCTRCVAARVRGKDPDELPIPGDSELKSVVSLPKTLPAQNPLAVLHGDYSDCSVLIVDDMPMNRMVMREMFRNFHVRTLIAGNAREALETLQISKVDLVLTDLRMPEMDGAQFARLLRASHPHSNFGIAAVTGDSDCCAGFDLTLFDEVYLKPFPLKNVPELLEKHVRAKRSPVNRG